MEQNPPTLEIKDLKVSVAGKSILDGVTLTIKSDEVHALMGPNGSGKSTLSYALAGHPRYKIDGGTARLDGKDILSLPPHERAIAGMFLAFQHPQEIQGLNMGHFLFSIAKARDTSLSPVKFKQRIDSALRTLGIDKKFLERQLNVGFSGGEKKRAEVLQLILSEPSLAILDETDSGLDVDSLRVVSTAVNSMRSPKFCALVITHYPHILQHLKPDVVHVLVKGKIAATGGSELANKIEKEGYAAFGGTDARDDVFKIV
ncbi:MAG: Fe-S cluster assembly ATPase SufC [Nanoarchaeota archaeon]